jgi:hypothetical protein
MQFCFFEEAYLYFWQNIICGVAFRRHESGCKSAVKQNYGTERTDRGVR